MSGFAGLAGRVLLGNGLSVGPLIRQPYTVMLQRVKVGEVLRGGA